MNTLRDPFSISIPSWTLNGDGTNASEERHRCDVGWEGQGCTCDARSVQCNRHNQSRHLDESTATLGRHYRRSTFMAPFVHHRTLPENRRGQRNISWLCHEMWRATRVKYLDQFCTAYTRDPSVALLHGMACNTIVILTTHKYIRPAMPKLDASRWGL